MAGGQRFRRRRGDDDTITVGELARRLDKHEDDTTALHRDQLRMIERLDAKIEKLDARTDTLATRIQVVFSVVAVLWAIFLVIAPALRALLGLAGTST